MKKAINSWSNMSDPLKSTVVFMIASFFSQGIGFLTTPIFTRLLTTTDYGIISVYNSWYSILVVIVLLSMTSAGVFNVGIHEFKEEKDNYIASLLFLTTITSLGFFLFYLVYRNIINQFIKLPTSLITLLVISLVFLPATSFWLAKQRYEYKYKSASVITFFSTVLSQLVSIIAVTNSSRNLAEIRLWSSSIITLGIAIILYFSLFSKGKQFYKIEYFKFSLKFTLPLIPHYLASNVLINADKIMIDNMVGKREAGIYSIVYTLSMIGNIVWTSINGSLVPYTFDKLDKNKYEDIKKVTNIVIIFYSIFCFLLVLLAPEIMKVLAPPEYYEGVYILPAVVGGVFLSAIYNLYVNIEFYFRKNKMIMLASVIAAVVNVLLNMLLIPRYGFIIAGYTTLVSYICLTVLHYFNMKSCTDKKIYDVKFHFLISLSSLFIYLITIKIYDYYFIRYLIVLSIVLIICFNISKIKENILLIKK